MKLVRLMMVFYLDYEYRRNIINRNRLQGTPLYLPWMPGNILLLVTLVKQYII